MPEQKNLLTKKIAWNGISLMMPEAWEIDTLDAAHMIIGKEGTPETEIKWTDAPGQFTLEKYLKDFISRAQKLLSIKIREQPTPHFFLSPDNNFKFFFFSWESVLSKGTGTLIFCPHCKRLTMIRFFSESKISRDSLQALILNSFKDHPEAEKINWQVFGFNFSTPLSLKLLEYSFNPGCYIINFKQKKTIITIFNWGPAAFLLSKISLAEFAKQRLPRLKGLAKVKSLPHGNYLEWAYHHGRFKNAELLPFMKKFFTVFRIYHNKPLNRLFGIMADSPDTFERDLINKINIGN